MTRWKKDVWKQDPLALITMTFLAHKFPPNHPDVSNSLSPPLVNNYPFLLPAHFSLLQIVIALETMWPVFGPFSPSAVIAAICLIFPANPSKARSGESAYVLAWPADKHTFLVWLKRDKTQSTSFAHGTTRDVRHTYLCSSFNIAAFLCGL